MAVKIQVEFLWVVTPCSDVVGHQRFGGSCCIHLQGEAKSLHGVRIQKTSTKSHEFFLELLFTTGMTIKQFLTSPFLVFSSF
jgi:hypothetical protein